MIGIAGWEVIVMVLGEGAIPIHTYSYSPPTFSYCICMELNGRIGGYEWDGQERWNSLAMNIGDARTILGLGRW